MVADVGLHIEGATVIRICRGIIAGRREPIKGRLWAAPPREHLRQPSRRPQVGGSRNPTPRWVPPIGAVVVAASMPTVALGIDSDRVGVGIHTDCRLPCLQGCRTVSLRSIPRHRNIHEAIPHRFTCPIGGPSHGDARRCWQQR